METRGEGRVGLPDFVRGLPCRLPRFVLESWGSMCRQKRGRRRARGRMVTISFFSLCFDAGFMVKPRKLQNFGEKRFVSEKC